MSKKKILALIGLFIVISWGIVSIYYYNKHVVTVKEYEVRETIEVSEGFVMLHNIEIHDFDRKQVDSGGFLWLHNSVLSKMPMNLQQAAMKVIAFYSDGYNSDLGTDDQEGRMMQINGIYVSNNGDDIADFREYVNVDVIAENGRNLTFSSKGYSATEGSNIILFSSRGEFLVNEYASNSNDILIIDVTDELGNENHEIIIEPEWETKKYNFFNSPPAQYSFNPGDVANSFIRDAVYNEELSAAKELIHPEVIDFPWGNLEHDKWSNREETITQYLGKHLEFDDVFSTKIAYSDSNTENSDADFEQMIYTVDYGGEWRIIDVSPLKTTE